MGCWLRSPFEIAIDGVGCALSHASCLGSYLALDAWAAA